MTQEEKQLLFKDLCARLPYGVKYNFGGNNGCDYTMDRISLTAVDDAFPIEDIKPYLRPMLSMTKEEYAELRKMTITSPNLEMAVVLFCERHYDEEPNWRNDWSRCGLSKVLDYLNARHFDHRGLIEKGLALEAPEGMYND